MRARARRLKRERGLDLIVVDYLQLMQVPGTKENRATEISEISRSLKALAKELKVPVIALSQLNRGVEQRVEKKPVMSDLRECVTGDTRVWLADGRRMPIRDLVGETPLVWAVGPDQKVVSAQSDLVWSKGIQPVFRVTLASGRSMRATASHRVLTGQGWRTIAEIGPGSRVALARRFPPVEDPVRWSDEALALLGHLVGDGSYPSHQPMRYTTASEENSEIVARAALSMGSTVTRHAGRGNWHQLVIANNGNRWHASGVGAWLKELGIYNQRSHDKRLPGVVFQLSDAQIGVLLKHLWATDGCISIRKASPRGGPRVYFSTCSELLAKDVAALLLRLGIIARIREFVQKSGRPIYSVDVSGSEQQSLFLTRVGAFGPRAEPARLLAARLASTIANSNVDTLPQEICTQIRGLMRSRGVTTRQMAAMRGTSYGGSSHFKFAPSRATATSYAELLDSDELRTWCDSDLFWDRVVAVEAAGDEEVFDLTVPGPASWLAEGVVNHNSGAIEQDADVILLIYREEVYEPNTTRKGIADIIIAKQRNGPTGDVQLTFLGQYTKFENFAPESYAEGVFR